MIYKTLTILALLIGVSGCAIRKDNTEARILESVTKIEAIACKKFNNDFEIQYNPKGNYALVQCTNDNKADQNSPNLIYFVYSVRDNIIIIEDSLKYGNIMWSDKYSVFASEKEENDDDLIRSYKYNLKKRNYRLL